MNNFSRLCPLFMLGMMMVTDVKAKTLWSVGHGYLSGGVIGAQYQNINDQQKFTLAVGLVGASAAWQVSLDKAQKHSVGLAAGMEVLTAESGFIVATYQYHPQGFHNSGMRYGFSAGIRREDEGRWWANNVQKDDQAAFALEIGYQF